MKIYVGTYHKYNCGDFTGEWVDLDDYSSKDEFLDACKEIHKDEEDPEFMFQDIEYDFEYQKLLCNEYGIDKYYWEIQDDFKRYGVNDKMFDAYCDLILINSIDVSNIQDCANNCLGKISLADYLRESLSETLNVPDNIFNYIDFDAMARDEICSGYYNESNDYLFTA